MASSAAPANPFRELDNACASLTSAITSPSDSSLPLAAASLSRLKRICRVIHSTVDSAYERVELAVKEVDADHLLLQNLQFQRHHIRREIDMCESFTPTAVPGLMTAAELQQEGLEPCAEGSLDLLNAEMRVRSDLLQQLQQHLMMKQEMEEHIRVATAELSDLTACLAPVLAASAPMRHRAATSSSSVSADPAFRELLEQLPLPLYSLACRAHNYSTVFDSSSSLELSVDAAPPPPPSSATVKTKRGRGGADDVQDEQPKFHEMSLSLTIPDATSPCRLKMHLTFDNRVASVVVCDSVDDSMSSALCPHSLAFLFPGDAGVDAGGGVVYGRSYHWLHDLCGLPSVRMPPTSTPPRSNAIFPKDVLLPPPLVSFALFVDAVRVRAAARLSIRRTMAACELLRLPILDAVGTDLSSAAALPLCLGECAKLKSCHIMTSSEMEALLEPVAADAMRAEAIRLQCFSTADTAQLHEHFNDYITQPLCLVAACGTACVGFKFVVSSGSCSLEATVVVPPDYPSRPSIAVVNCVTVGSRGAFSEVRRHVEAEVNHALLADLTNACSGQLPPTTLALQVCTLACSAAVISDCDAQAAASGFKYELPPVFNGRGAVPPLKFDRVSGKFQLRM